jgi:competence protein ComEA
VVGEAGTVDDDPLARLRAGAEADWPDGRSWLVRAADLLHRLHTQPASRVVALSTVAVVAVVLTVVGLLAVSRWSRADEAAPSAPPLSLPLAPSPVGPDDQAPTEIVVHAAGAVSSPGVYRLDPSARVADLVDAAGGLAPDADGDRLNLAGLLSDGARVYVLRQGQSEVPAIGDAGSDSGAPAPGGDGTAALVDVNRASAAELEQLPGIGPATSAAIIAHRDRNGPFRAVDDLIDVRGIGPAKLEQLRDLVRV